MELIDIENGNKYAELASQISVLSNAAYFGRSEKEQRFRKSYLYYACLEPKATGNEISGYVEPVLRKAVEAVKPSLMNVFTENERRAVHFRPIVKNSLGIDMEATGMGSAIAKAIDEYINQVFIRENEGFDIVDRAITEALVTGDVFLKYFIEENEVKDTLELDKFPEEALNALLEEWPDTDMDKLYNNVTKRKGMLTGRIKVKRIEKDIKVEFIPFADIFITGQHENIQDSRYVCQRILTTVGAMVEKGYEMDMVSTSSTFFPRNQYGPLSTERLVNLGVFGEDLGDQVVTVDPMERQIYIFEHYLYSSLVDKRSKGSKLYRVLSTDTNILSVEEAPRIPFVHGVPERIPGSFWGTSFYDKFGPAQDMISRLIRAIEFNVGDGAYGRYIAIEGQYDRQSLLNNRPGSVIHVKQDIGAVQRFQQYQLPQSIDVLINRLESSYREDAASAAGVDVTGANMSATAAMITANTADLKDKVIAKTLAYTLFRPLFEGIYDIIVAENIKIGEVPNPQVQEAMAGVEAGQLDPAVLQEIPEMLPISGADLPPVADFIIDINTSNDDAILNNQLINLMTMFAQVPPGTVNTQEMAAQLTGLPMEEIEKFFPLAPQPTEEEIAMQQAQQQMALEQGALQSELLKSQVGKTAVETFQIEKKIEQDVKDAEAKRLREEEKSLQQFKILELKEEELKAELTGQKIQISDF